jgi:hypothetical protein
LSYVEAYYEAMSPSLLAQQPASTSGSGPAPGKDWGVIYQALEARLGALRTWRYSWWQYWASLAEFILPRRYKWLVTANTMNRWLPINNAIVDSTATLAMQICASGMWTGLTSPSRPWFKLGLALPWAQLDAEGEAWLYDTEQRLYAVLGGSNFYTIMAQAFQDVATFGTAPVIIYEDFEDVIRCYLPCAGEYYLAVGARLSVDTLYREFTLTTRDIVEMFGFDNCPAEIQKLWADGGASLEQESVVAHAIEPNTALSGKRGKGDIRVVPGNFPYREVYWLKGAKTERELSRKGFTEKPFFAARWSTVSNDAYGRSPGMDALGDTKQLQMETRRKGEFIEKLVRPPMGADVELKNEPSSILPGHITYTNTQGGKKGFYPLFEVSPAALSPMVDDITKVQDRINRAFFVDVFMAITRMEGVQPRNELELTKRDLERLQVLGPFIELFETECAGPAITRVLGILERRKMLLPRPKSMQNMPLNIDYISMLKLAQRASETASMERTFAVAGNLSAAAKAAGVADPIRVINLDESFRLYAEMVSFPSKGLYSPDQVEEHDQARLKATQQQQMLQATLPAVDAAKTLSDTNVGGGQSALTAMLGGGGRV